MPLPQHHTSKARGLIRERFEACRLENRAALVPYLTAGYPDGDQGAAALDAVASAGSDVIELGVPFSDPLADGPTIQAATFTALEGGMSVRGTLDQLRVFRRSWDTPVVLFSYLNPLLSYGLDRFVADAHEAGAQGLLLTDLPSGADPDLEAVVQSSELDLIRLLAPTTASERVPEVVRGGQGFLYYISRTGVTGARERLREGLVHEVDALRRTVDLPIAVGFGISTPEQAAMVAAVADGVVVGSALIQALARGGPEAAGELTASLRSAMGRPTT